MKSKKLYQNKISVKKSRIQGYGVFADKTIRKGHKIEQCYMLITRGGDKGLEDFYFNAKGKNAILTGYGSIYNHSDDPNTDYTININNKLATIKAVRTIYKGEEIFVSYGNKWFTSRKLKPKHTAKKS